MDAFWSSLSHLLSLFPHFLSVILLHSCFHFYSLPNTFELVTVTSDLSIELFPLASLKHTVHVFAFFLSSFQSLLNSDKYFSPGESVLTLSISNRFLFLTHFCSSSQYHFFQRSIGRPAQWFRDVVNFLLSFHIFLLAYYIMDQRDIFQRSGSKSEWVSKQTKEFFGTNVFICEN